MIEIPIAVGNALRQCQFCRCLQLIVEVRAQLFLFVHAYAISANIAHFLRNQPPKR